MSEIQSGEDPEPSQPVPAGTLFVPVRSGSVGSCVRLFRTPLGDRTAVAFTSRQQLMTTLGEQPWIMLSEPAVRALIEPLGVTTLTVDPQLAAPVAIPRQPVAAAPAPMPRLAAASRPAAAARAPESPGRDRRPAWDAQTVGVLRVTGLAAAAACLSFFGG